jgi:hypothetical protein
MDAEDAHLALYMLHTRRMSGMDSMLVKVVHHNGYDGERPQGGIEELSGQSLQELPAYSVKPELPDSSF